MELIEPMSDEILFLVSTLTLIMSPPGHISLKVPNVKFNFDVSVDSMQLLTHTSKT